LEVTFVEWITALVIVAFLLVLLSYDVFAQIVWGTQATISQVMLTQAKLYPMIPFLFGLLFGHFFWPQR
jgi:hypothetical protein